MNHITKYRLQERRALSGDSYSAAGVDFESRDLALDEMDRLIQKHPTAYLPSTPHRLVVTEVRS